MAFEEMLQELETRKDKALQMGGPKRVQRQHDQGKLTARERIDKLLGTGSFMEFGLYCTSDQPGMQDCITTMNINASRF